MKDTFHGTATLYRNEKTGTVTISIPKEEGSKLEIDNKETLVFESDGEEIRLVPARTIKLFKNKSGVEGSLYKHDSWLVKGGRFIKNMVNFSRIDNYPLREKIVFVMKDMACVEQALAMGAVVSASRGKIHTCLKSPEEDLYI